MDAGCRATNRHPPNRESECEDIHHALDAISALIKPLREGVYYEAVKTISRPELIDSAFDTNWVTLGLLAAMGVDGDVVFEEGKGSNYSKFVKDGHGNLIALKDQTGKVIKPAGYYKPNFGKFA